MLHMVLAVRAAAVEPIGGPSDAAATMAVASAKLAPDTLLVTFERAEHFESASLRMTA